MIRDLAEFARVAGGKLHGANCAFAEVPRTAVRSRRARCSWRSPASDSTATNSSPRRRLAAPRAQSLRGRSPPRSRRSSCRTCSRRSGRFANAWRRDFAGTVVGITGSNGKTTVKEMTGAILGACGPCLVTRGNLNNHIGVPLTLARLDSTHRFAVIEMGANHQREIAHLASICEPDVGLVINAGPAHLEGFGGIDGVARGKGEMFEALGVEGHGGDQRGRPVTRHSGTALRVRPVTS